MDRPEACLLADAVVPVAFGVDESAYTVPHPVT